MKSFKIGKVSAAMVFVAFLLSACETPKPVATPTTAGGPSTPSDANAKAATAPAATTSAPKPIEPAPAAPVATRVKPEQLLAEGTELYEKGDYKGAIRKLLIARDASDEVPAVKQNTLRLLAFSYCVTNQRPLCKAQFASLLKANPAFQLSRGEAGHPQWGPVFKEAKLAVAATPVKPTK